MRIYLDESGYTGEDLLKEDQPHFVICTHAIDENTCAEIKAKYFSEVQAKELKHSQLASRGKQARMLLNALRDLTDNHYDKILVGVSDKRYSLLAKIVDLIIELSMHRAGYNLYKRGGNIAMTNVMYMCMGLDPPYLDRILRAFQRWMRERSLQARTEFAQRLAIPHPMEQIDDFRQRIVAALKHVGYGGVLRGLDRGVLDLSLSTAMNLIGMWRWRIDDEPFQLIHDQSTNMAKQKRMWDALVSETARPAVVGYDNRKRKYPLNVSETKFVDGKTSAALQIADILAGATSAVLKRSTSSSTDEYTNGLQELWSNKPLDGYYFLPSTAISPEEMGTVGDDGEDPLEYTAQLRAKAASADGSSDL
jgi:hypothetical protein